MTYTKEDWRAFLDAKDNNELCEIDEGIYDYFQRAARGLPPRLRMYGLVTLCDGETAAADFGFAEGAEVITAFWRTGDKFYCQNTTMVSRGD